MLSRLPFLLAVGGTLSLAACGNMSTRLGTLSEVPGMAKTKNPTETPGYQPLSMPTPAPVAVETRVGSIWQPGARAFFKDQRASRVGDVVTVTVTINDNANLQNETQGTRKDSDAVNGTNLFGIESILPAGITASSLINTGNNRSTDGKGQITRSEQINVQLAATVTQILANGNLVIVGRQQVRVDYNLRDMEFSGVIRPVDIDALNTIAWAKVAEARISYGGQGTSEDLQQTRWGSQLIDILSPF